MDCNPLRLIERDRGRRSARYAEENTSKLLGGIRQNELKSRPIESGQFLPAQTDLIGAEKNSEKAEIGKQDSGGCRVKMAEAVTKQTFSITRSESEMASWNQADFIQAWVEEGSIEKVAERLGESAKAKTRLRAYASSLRKAGIPLRQMRGTTTNTPDVDPNAGLALLAKLTGKPLDELQAEGQKAAENAKAKGERVRKAVAAASAA